MGLSKDVAATPENVNSSAGLRTERTIGDPGAGRGGGLPQWQAAVSPLTVDCQYDTALSPKALWCSNPGFISGFD